MKKQSNSTFTRADLIKAVLRANYPDGKASFSIGEFARMIGEPNKTVVKYHLNKLEEEGFLKFTSRGVKGNRELKNVVLFGKAKDEAIKECDIEVQFEKDTMHICNSNIGYVVSIEEVARELMFLPTTAQKIIQANAKQFEHYVVEIAGKQYLNGSGLMALISKINLDRAKPEKVERLKSFQMWIIENLVNISSGKKDKITTEDVQTVQDSITELTDIAPEQIHMLLADIQKKVESVLAVNNSLREKLKKEEAKSNVLSQNLQSYRQELSAMREKILNLSNI